MGDTKPTYEDLLSKIKELESELQSIQSETHLSDNMSIQSSDDINLLLFQDLFFKHSAIKLLIDPDNNGAIVEANDAALDFYGYTRDELLGLTIFNLNTLPEEQVLQKMASAKDQKLNIFTFDHKRNDGSIRTVRVHSHPLHWKKRLLLHSIIYDITEQKQMEALLNKSEEKFRTLLQNSYDIVSIISVEGIVLYESNSTQLVLGYEAGERVGDYAFDYVHPGDVDKAKKEFRDLSLNPNFKKTIEIRMLHKSGTWKFLSVTGQNFIDNPVIGGILTNAHDISERVQAEQKLKESEHLFRSLVNNQGEGVGIVDELENFVFINPAGLRIFNRNVEEMLYHNLKEFIQPKYFHLIEEETELRKSGASSTYELNILLPNGTLRTILLTATPQFNDKGTFTGTLGIFRDISDRKKMEMTLRKNERRINNILEGTNAGSWSWNIKTDELELNERWADMLGYFLEELKPININTFYKLVHSEDLEVINNALQKHINGITEHYDVEIRMLHKNNKYIWINARGKIFEWTEEGEPLIMSGTHLDVTKRKQAELQLLESEANFRNIVNNALAGIVKCNSDKDITFINKAFADLLDYEQRDLLRTNINDLIHPDESEMLFNLFSKLDDYHVPFFRAQNRYLTKHNTIIWGEAFVSLQRNIDNSFKSYLIVVIDITSRKAAEEELRELNATKDKLLAIISHDLRNPFHNILSSSKMLLDFCSNKNYNEVPELASIIHRSSTNAYEKLNELLEWTKIQTGKIVVNKSLIPVDQFVKKILEHKNDQAQAKDIELHTNNFDPFTINADIRMLQSVFENLLSNAIKFSKPGSEILFLVEQEDKTARFVIQDSGVGISSDRLNSIFDITKVYSTEGTYGEKGSGLGLILCKEFIDMHKGTFEVESQLGKGSSFIVRLPKV